jgi:hypothetical protein
VTGNHREKILIQSHWRSSSYMCFTWWNQKPPTKSSGSPIFHLSPARSQDCCPWSEIGPPVPPHFIHFSASFAPCFFWCFTDQDMAHASIPSSHLRSVSGPSSVWRRIARLSVPCQLGVRHRGYSTIECGEAWRMPNEHIGKASSLRPKWRMQRIEFSICFHWPGMVGGIRKTCPMMASQA